MTQDNQIVAFDISGPGQTPPRFMRNKVSEDPKGHEGEGQNITTNHPLLMPPDVPLANADKSHTGCADPC